jgi:hypothetical protein
MGAQTLSADDIANYYLQSEGKPFTFVLLADKGKDEKSNDAEILIGEEGKKKLQALMKKL